MQTLNPIWKEHINQEMSKEYGVKLRDFVKTERLTKHIYPASENLMDAFRLCDYSDLKVVILGNEPYHSPMTSHGLAFSSLQSNIPPSLQNIFKEIKNDEYDRWTNSSQVLFKNPNLTEWAVQGVLLLNTVMTVEKGVPGSHKNKGWEQFTIATINFLNNYPGPLIYMLWGNNAKEYKQYINLEKHTVLEANHPSPMTADRGGWFGCKHFSKANQFIAKHYFNIKPTICWAVLNQ